MSTFVISSEIYSLLAQIDATLNQKELLEQSNNLIINVNEGIVSLDEDIRLAFSELKSSYARRFPELETVNISILEYVTVVLLIGDSPILSKIDFSSLQLPHSALMILSMCSTTSSGQIMDKLSLDRCILISNFILTALDIKTKLLAFIKGQMSIIAPCLSAIVGSTIAALLIGTAGGLKNLSSMPSGNILALGSNVQISKLGTGGDLAGFSKTSFMRTGFISQCEIVKNIHQDSFKIRATRLIAGKCSLAARYDADHIKENISSILHNTNNGSSPSKYGQELRVAIGKKIEKMLEPPPIQKPKPLPAPKEYAKQRRGGKRVKKQRESVVMTELRKLQNRMTFGLAPEQEVIYGDEIIGLGQVILGENKEALLDSYSKIANPKPNDKARAKLIKKAKESTSKFSFTSGIISSLSISNGQGIQLQNPNVTHQPSASLKGILTSTNVQFQ